VVTETAERRNGVPEVRQVVVMEQYLSLFRAGLRQALEQLSPEPESEEVRYAEIRKTYPRAYEKWSPEEDARLMREFEHEKSMEVLSRRFQRQPGAILSRLGKLGSA
jgi:hypothetical protein